VFLDGATFGTALVSALHLAQNSFRRKLPGSSQLHERACFEQSSAVGLGGLLTDRPDVLLLLQVRCVAALGRSGA